MSYQCQSCSKTSSDLRRMEEHAASGSCTLKLCAMCHTNFKNLKDFRSHLKTCSRLARPSVLCSEKSFPKILKVDLPNSYEKLDYECPQCGLTYKPWTSCRKNSYRLKRHFTQNYSILTTSLSVASTEKPVLGLHIPAGRQYYLYTGVIYTVPTGTYELEDLQKLLKAQLDKLYGIKFDLDVNLNTLQCGVKCSKKIDFGFEDTFGELLGFNPKAQLIPNQYNWSTDIIHVFKVSTIGISVSCCEGSYINDQESHVIYQFSPDVEPGYKLRQEPALVTYHPVVGEKLETVTIKVVDQDGTLIDFRNELIVVRLHFKIRA
ncbi:unnamed protein product [Nesidiocoris tenuis]|uniref:Uncharacterized protein n=1 Tax=Nesidiocoris tenuis TaxID=355587 RepID=A0A6H5GDE4_9HEMI|nr:unnamed protein product [Nesidiocoris tenuis]CAB0001524.1 unnamed protein product [Nesidiocoris tenuis]